MAGFLIPAGTNSGTSPDEISRRRALAEMLAQQGMGEVRNPWEGLANIGVSFLAGRQLRKADREEKAGRKSGMDALIAALAGGGQSGGANPQVIAALDPSRAMTGGVGSDVAADASGQANQYRNAIAGIESAGSGDYSALGPVTKTGDRAYGRYQVMGANIPAWTKQALGREMTPEEFLADPRAQDATFDAIFGGFAKKSGPEGAARQWFTGSPTGTGSDQLGTSGDEYASRFNAALRGSGMPQESVSTYDPQSAGGNNDAMVAALLGNEWIPPELKKLALDRLMPAAGDPFTLGEGDIRYSGSGQEIARGAPKPQEPRILSEGAQLVDNAGKLITENPKDQPPIGFSDVSSLRKEVQDLPSYKSYQMAVPAVNSMVESFGKDTRAADLDYVYALARVFDPNSVVREGEMVLVNNTQSLPDQLVGYINALNGGERLTPDTRRALWEAASGRMAQYKEQLDADLGSFRDIAGRYGLNEADIIPNIVPLKTLAPENATATAQPSVGDEMEWDAVPEGALVEDDSGKRFRKQGGRPVPVQ